MVLQVSGGGDLGAHGAYYQDAKYVYIHPSEKGYAGEKFYQYNRGSGMDLVVMPQGPDFIRVSDSEGAPCDCDYGYGPPPAHLFQVIGGKMKIVLSYHHNEEHPHDNYYFQSRLIPFKNRDFRVVSRETRRDWYSTVDNSRIITLVTADFYHWDPAAQEYKSVGKTKPLTLFDWDQATQPGTADTGP
jgi:hypothetical protein